MNVCCQSYKLQHKVPSNCLAEISGQESIPVEVGTCFKQLYYYVCVK